MIYFYIYYTIMTMFYLESNPQSIWGYEYMGDTNVVDVYIRYLRAKIDDYFNEKLTFIQ